MSKRVMVTCGLILILGVAGGLDSASAISKGEVHINLLTLLLPVGIGLSMAAPGARLAATIVFSILYLFLGMLLITPSIGPTLAKVQIMPSGLAFHSAFPVIFVYVTMLGSLLALLHWMLFSPPFDEHLNA